MKHHIQWRPSGLLEINKTKNKNKNKPPLKIPNFFKKKKT